MRLFIIGAAGSGKTTLAKYLSGELHVQAINLDDLFWNNSLNKYGVRRDETERNRMLDEEISKSSWIIEGAYIAWPIKAIKASDRIIHVDTPKFVTNYRILKRFIKRKLRIEKQTKKETLRGVLELIKWNNNQIKEIAKLVNALKQEKQVDAVRNGRDICQLKEKLFGNKG